MNNDLISRSALKKSFYDQECWNVVIAHIIDHVPTVEERPKGKWIKLKNMSKRSYQRVCNQCHNISYFCGDGNYPNCPYCLADMREVDNEDKT